MKKEDYEDLTLPDEKSETDSKSIFEEDRSMTEFEKRNLERQKQFEFREVEGAPERKKEEERLQKKGNLLSWVFGILTFLFLIGLYFFLIK